MVEHQILEIPLRTEILVFSTARKKSVSVCRWWEAALQTTACPALAREPKPIAIDGAMPMWRWVDADVALGVDPAGCRSRRRTRERPSGKRGSRRQRSRLRPQPPPLQKPRRRSPWCRWPPCSDRHRLRAGALMPAKKQHMPQGSMCCFSRTSRGFAQEWWPAMLLLCSGSRIARMSAVHT